MTLLERGLHIRNKSFVSGRSEKESRARGMMSRSSLPHSSSPEVTDCQMRSQPQKAFGALDKTEVVVEELSLQALLPV